MDVSQMAPARAKAYRYILYFALLELRTLQCFAWRLRDRVNPFYWRNSISRIRAEGALADWLHNLGAFSAHDFEEFDEDRFWQEYDYMKVRYGAFWHLDYRNFFADRLSEFQSENKTT